VLTSTMRLPGVADPPEDRQAGTWRDLELYWRDHELLRPSLRRRLAIERHNQSILDAALDDFGPDVVSCWNMGALSMGILTTLLERRIPTVLVVCDDWLVSGPLLDPWARLFTRRRLLAGPVRRVTGVPTAVADLGHVDAVCFVSESVRQTALDNTSWSFPRSAVTFSGIERDEFPLTAPDEGARPWQGRLLYAGRVEPRKGVQTAVRALALLPPTSTLALLGPVESRYRSRLEALAGSLGVGGRVRFDNVERAALRQRYLDADAVLVPSEWAEPFGLVPLEAMACGRPVVATGTGGSGEFLVDGANCLLFAPGRPEALAAAVGRLSGDPALRQRLVEGGLRTAGAFHTDRLADVLEEWHVAAGGRFAHGAPPDRRPAPPGVTR
jgi:glycosyltransferase involved in cell wall biosynthesis